MNGFDWSDFGTVTAASVLVLAVLQAATFLVGRRIGRYNVVDVSWGGLGFVLVALVAAVIGDGDTLRRWLVVVLVAVWGLRLTWHMYAKSAGKGEDPRYVEMLDRAGGDSPGVVVRKIFLTQGLAQWFVSLPLQVSAVLGPASGLGAVVGVLGVLLWVVGVVFESVGDHQLKAFKADPSNKGEIMDVGLWAWTRHPNYFGDSCVWWGTVAHRGERVARSSHCAVSGGHDVFPGVRDRREAAREVDVAATRLPRIPAAHQLFPSLAAEAVSAMPASLAPPSSPIVVTPAATCY